MEKWTCRWCGKELVCKSKFSKSSHLANCAIFKKWRDSTITKEFLIEKYVNQQMSLPEIAKELQLAS